VRGVRHQQHEIGARLGGADLMPRERYFYALAGWTVEKRAKGWYFSRTATRHSKDDWQGPYCSEASVAMMIARQLRREIIERYERQMRGNGALNAAPPAGLV
jgi:hypothetical protein